MAKKSEKARLMSHSDLPLYGVDEVRQSNRLFLGYLRSRPDVAIEHFALPASATDLLRQVTAEQLDRAADFPRALFRLELDAVAPGRVMDSLSLGDESGLQILQLTLLLNAWSLARISGYSAPLLLRLDDASVQRLRESGMAGILEISRAMHVVRAAYEDLGWIWQELIAEARPERRQRLLLLGLQPDFSLRVARGAA
jgi:hypothetical protein